LILSGNTLYGTAEYGGSLGRGTVFAVNTNGTGFTNLYNFTDGNDGANPIAGLLLSGTTIYGTAVASGSSGYGTVFALNFIVSAATPPKIQGTFLSGNSFTFTWNATSSNIYQILASAV